VFLVEGPTDAVALVDAFPFTVALGVPGGNTPSRAWGKALVGLDVFIVADADEQGDRYRLSWAAAITPHATRVWHVRVPAEWNDVDGWRRGAGEAFRDEFLAAVGGALEGGAP
jgi:hypothetical protein